MCGRRPSIKRLERSSWPRKTPLQLQGRAELPAAATTHKCELCHPLTLPPVRRAGGSGAPAFLLLLPGSATFPGALTQPASHRRNCTVSVSDLATIFSAAPPLQSLAQVPPASLASFAPPAVAVAVMPRPPLFSMPPKKKAQPKPKSKLQVCCRR